MLARIGEWIGDFRRDQPIRVRSKGASQRILGSIEKRHSSGIVNDGCPLDGAKLAYRLLRAIPLCHDSER